VRIQPPLVIGEEELDRAIGVIEEAVSSLSAQPVA
jgi:4-aminobutyrate aminotransferase-like enzyme